MRKAAWIAGCALVCVGMAVLCGCGDSGTNPQASGNSIVSFGFVDTLNSAIATTVSGQIYDSIVVVTVPLGTNRSNMVATFATTGDTVKIDSVVQESGVTRNNFTDPIVYTVVSSAGVTSYYTIIVVNEPAQTSKDITAFSFRASQNAALTYTVNGVIGEDTIAIELTTGTDVTALVATFTSTGSSVAVGPSAQQSGVTVNDFTNPVVYVVTAPNGTTRSYTVVITFVPATNLLSFSFGSSTNTSLGQTAYGTVSGDSVRVTIPAGTPDTALVATFTTNGDSVMVGSVTQVSGQTSNNFSSPVTYTVYGSNTSKAYTVVVALDTIDIVGTWNHTGTTTYALVVEVDSVRVQRAADTSAGHIEILDNSDSLCVLYWAVNAPDASTPYQKMRWDMISSDTLVIGWYNDRSNLSSAYSTYWVASVDTLIKP